MSKLISIASLPVLTPPCHHEIERLSSAGGHAGALFELLSEKNGWYAFESALHLFPLGRKEGVLDLESWNSAALWRQEFHGLADGCFFFAEDVFGVQFCFKSGQVHTFDPETGGTRLFADDLPSWARTILSDYELHTGYPLARDWQSKYGPLKQGRRLLPKVPFSLGGAYTVENVYDLDCIEGMRFRASIAVQMRDVPPGTRVKLRVTQ